MTDERKQVIYDMGKVALTAAQWDILDKALALHGIDAGDDDMRRELMLGCLVNGIGTLQAFGMLHGALSIIAKGRAAPVEGETVN